MGKITQKMLDSAQYQRESILRYELVYGRDFVSPGGAEVARELVASLGLEPGARVLDVGCGLGGSAFVMAREFGLVVDGIDLSRNMLELAGEKLEAHGLGDRVALRWGDCLELDTEDTYDAVYSRDVFLHIADKPRLFRVLARALRPGGRLLFTDYCCGPKPWSGDFAAYVESRGYHLHTLDAYAALLAGAGLARVEADDWTPRFIAILGREAGRIERLDIDPTERESLLASWRQKIDRARGGEHRWGLFRAVKPGAAGS